MTRLLLLTHGQLGQELVQVAQTILEKDLEVTLVSLEWEKPNEDKILFLRALFAALEEDEQVIALTDSFGGTPSNMILGYLSPGRVEIITGVNLSMLLYLGNADLSGDLQSICQSTKKAGQEAILIAGEFL